MDRALERRLSQAAEVVSQEARRIAAGFSRHTAASIRVVPNRRGDNVTIVAGGTQASRMAYPFEVGARHPVFARRGSKRYIDGPWVPTAHRPFMEVAKARRIDSAANQLANVLDDWVDEVLPK